jgi:hypothetical protein
VIAPQKDKFLKFTLDRMRFFGQQALDRIGKKICTPHKILRAHLWYEPAAVGRQITDEFA